MDNNPTTTHGPGLIGGLTGLAKNTFGLLVSRLELAAMELTEVRNHAVELVVMFAVAVICSWFAIAYGTAMIVAATSVTFRLGGSGRRLRYQATIIGRLSLSSSAGWK